MLISKRLQKFKAYFQSFRMGSNEKGFFVQAPISVSVMSKQVNSTYTGCPIDMETHSDPILQFLDPHILKSKTCF